MERRFLISDAEHRPIAIAHLESPANEKPFNLLIQTYEPGMPSTALSIQQKITLIDIDNDLAMEGTIVNHAADLANAWAQRPAKTCACAPLLKV